MTLFGFQGLSYIIIIVTHYLTSYNNKCTCFPYYFSLELSFILSLLAVQRGFTWDLLFVVSKTGKPFFSSPLSFKTAVLKDSVFQPAFCLWRLLPSGALLLSRVLLPPQLLLHPDE